jgi:hypothetical protein
MLSQFFLKFVLAAVFGIGVDDGYATVFGTPGDVHAGGPLACEHRPIPQDEPLCAHRHLPCGTQIVVVNLERNASTTCRVADRGPYGVNKHGRWRGLIDLTPHVATSVKLDGRDKVRLFYLMPPKTSAMYKSYQWLSPPVKRSRDSM